jgi:hypothetical protein
MFRPHVTALFCYRSCEIAHIVSRIVPLHASEGAVAEKRQPWGDELVHFREAAPVAAQ